MRVEIFNIPIDLIVVQIGGTLTICLAVIAYASLSIRSMDKVVDKLSDRIETLESTLAAVMESSSQIAQIRNNLRQLQAAAHQFMLENGKNSALFSDLLGPTKYIREIRPVAAEKYDTQPITIEDGPIAVLPSGKVIRLAN